MVEDGFFCLPPSVLKAQFTADAAVKEGKAYHNYKHHPTIYLPILKC